MKKKLSALLLALVLILSLLPTGALAADTPWNGSDKKEPAKVGDVYQIGTAAELAWFANHVNNTVACSDNAVLTADIDLNNKSWTPIGTKSNVADQYKGNFDGNYHIISGLSITTAAANQGLFGLINGSTIQKLKVEGTISCGTSNYIGGIVGKMQAGSIINCSFSGSVAGGYVGGIAGYAGNTSNPAVEIQGCANSGTIQGTYAGGIVSYAKYSTISNCYNTGAITGTTRAGGLAGQLQNNCTVQYCYNTGLVSGSTTAADISDFLYTSSSLSNCFYNGAKLVGTKNGTVTDCDKITTQEVLLGLLNSDSNNAWIADAIPNINGGYPLLNWQSTAPVEKVPVTGVSVTSAGSPRAGQTLSAAVSGAEGKTPTGLSYQWMLGDRADGAFIALSGETKRTLALTDALIGKYLYLYVSGDESSEASSDVLGPVLLSETAAVAADKVALAEFPAIRENGPLALPASGANGSAITWISGSANVIADDGTVTLPATSDASVKLTATIRCGAVEDTRNFYVTVLSRAKVNSEADDATYLDNAIAKLSAPGLTPVYGTDTNICAVLQTAFAKQGYGEIQVALKSAENPTSGPAAGKAAIAPDGGITYFYSDPNTLGAPQVTQIRVVFTLTKGSSSAEISKNAVIGWDEEKILSYLNAEIFSALEIPTEVSADFDLPIYIGGKDGKTWVKLSYAVSDESAMTISEEKRQGSADNLYNPYVGKPKTLSADKSVRLTVTAEFNYSRPSSVYLTRSYDITVKADPGAVAAREAELSAKLDKGLAAPGLTDYVTGAKLAETDAVYIAGNDIQFPTTRDYGVDGKYYPVLITSSDEDVIATSGINNAARVYVYRPLPGEAAKTVTLTVMLTEKASGIFAQKSFDVIVQPLTQAEIDTELTLMTQVKANYFNGIKNANASADQVTGNLHAFQEAYLDAEGKLTFVYDYTKLVRHGIVPTAMEGWADTEQWRLFRSSNPAVVTHENLLVTQQNEHKAVTVTSYLSSETLGKYAAKYPDNADFQKLYYQPVSAALIVHGKAPTSIEPVVETLNVSFTLQSTDSTWLARTPISGLAEGSTVFDLFTKVLGENGYSYAARGSYIYAITTPGGKTLSELDAGANSGWMYKVNGVTPSAYMAAYPLRNGDNVVVFFTKDYTQDVIWGEPGSAQNGTVIRPQATAHNGKAEAAVDSEAVSDALSNNNGRVVIAPQITGDAQQVSVSMPNASVKAIAENSAGALCVETGCGTLDVPREALAAIAAQAGDADIKITLETKSAKDVNLPASELENAVIIEIGISSGGKNITAFNGGALSASIPVTGDYKAGEAYKVIVISADGRIEEQVGTIVVIDGRAFAEVRVTHLSTFVFTATRVAVYDDVKTGAWYYDAVQYTAQKGLMKGISETSFGPDTEVSRAMFVTILYRLAGAPAVSGENAFSDVSAGAWYTDAILWASNNGIVDGRGSGSFGTNDTITREEAAAILYRYAAFQKLDVSKTAELSAYVDADAVSAWALAAVRWANAGGFITGTAADALSPQKGMTRAQAALVLMRFCKSTEK